MKDQERKQVEALKILKPDNQHLSIKHQFPEDKLSGEAKIQKVKKKMISREISFIKYIFIHTISINRKQKYLFSGDIYTRRITTHEPDKDKSDYQWKLQFSKL